jgi:formate hydrogenlyase subunit 6/NADH:ubiquinone oxidoreductase subunit I
MTQEKLEFRIRSGGTITLDLAQCVECRTQVCLRVCQTQGGPLVLDEARGVPRLRWSPAEVERGGCVECLGCELDCATDGRKAVTIVLPLCGLDEYLDSLTEPVVYTR